MGLQYINLTHDAAVLSVGSIGCTTEGGTDWTGTGCRTYRCVEYGFLKMVETGTPEARSATLAIGILLFIKEALVPNAPT